MCWYPPEALRRYYKKLIKKRKRLVVMKPSTHCSLSKAFLTTTLPPLPPSLFISPPIQPRLRKAATDLVVSKPLPSQQVVLIRLPLTLVRSNDLQQATTRFAIYWHNDHTHMKSHPFFSMPTVKSSTSEVLLISRNLKRASLLWITPSHRPLWLSIRRAFCWRSGRLRLVGLFLAKLSTEMIDKRQISHGCGGSYFISKVVLICFFTAVIECFISWWFLFAFLQLS